MASSAILLFPTKFILHTQIRLENFKTLLPIENNKHDNADLSTMSRNRKSTLQNKEVYNLNSNGFFKFL